MYRIIVPVDDSSNSLAATGYAIRLAAARPDASIDLVNAQPALNRHVARFASQRAGVECRPVVLRGEPAQAIARFAAETGADEMVLGTSRKSALLRLVTGSITDRLLARSEVPVAMVLGDGPSALQRYGIPAGVGAGLAALLIAAD
jgi:nucleotide-binding universal stress UspA family protein